jgi:hypothetical protein
MNKNDCPFCRRARFALIWGVLMLLFVLWWLQRA